MRDSTIRNLTIRTNAKRISLLLISGIALSLLYSCAETPVNTSSPKNVKEITSPDAETNPAVYSVMYRVWNQEECETQVEGVLLDRLFKDGQFNGFVCLSRNVEQVGQIDTIGINFRAENLEDCKSIVGTYWSGSPSNRYTFYQNPSQQEQDRFLVGVNTCSVEYPNP